MKSFEASFSTWLESKAPALDDACGAAMQEGLAGLSGPDLEAANQSINNLYFEKGPGKAFRERDCDYSLRGIGPLYTGHWHGKRVHEAIAILMPLRALLLDRPMNLIDVGAGTDAVLWAWTLIASFASSQDSPPYPVHSWTSIDSSQEMIAQSDRLWTRLCAVLPEAERVVKRQPPLWADWRKSHSLPANAIVLGSYLFSKADADASRRTAPAFAAFLKNARAASVVLWTTKNKRGVLDRTRTELAGWWDVTPKTLFDCPLKGKMRKCLTVMEDAADSLSIAKDAQWDSRFNWGLAPLHTWLLAMTASKIENP